MKDSEESKKRQSKRKPMRVDLDLIEGAILRPFYSKDISKGGIFIETLTPLPIGTEVDLKFTLPMSSETIKVKGRVVHTISKKQIGERESLVPGMGIKFINLAHESEMLIYEFVRGN